MTLTTDTVATTVATITEFASKFKPGSEFLLNALREKTLVRCS